MKKFILKSYTNGLFYVKGLGFTATDCKLATQLTAQEINTLGSQGFYGNAKEVISSYAVMYVRLTDTRADGGVNANTSNPSKRRFATFDEAVKHGSRFQERKASADAAPGSAGHCGFWVRQTSDAVNSAVNWKTGLTNSL